MNRSFSFEKKVQPSQYEPIMVSTTINDVPEELWKDEKFVDNINKLMIIQTYKFLIAERNLFNELKETEENAGDFLNRLEEETLQNLNGKEIEVETKEIE